MTRKLKNSKMNTQSEINQNQTLNTTPLSKQIDFIKSMLENEKEMIENSISNSDCKYSKWSDEDDRKLKELIFTKGSRNWNKIADCIGSKSARQCMHRWYKVIKPNIEPLWKQKDEQVILDHVTKYGTKNWIICAKSLGKGISAKSCKDRYFKTLSKSSSSNSFLPEEDLTLLLSVKRIGTQWRNILNLFPGKNENSLKNKCYSILRRKASQIIGTDKARLLKTNELLNFIPQAIEDYRKCLEPERFDKYYYKFFPKVNEPYHHSHGEFSRDQTGKLVINLCTECMKRLKERIKNKIFDKIIQKGLISNIRNEYNSFSL